MGSGYQFPQSDFSNKFRDPSFSAYLNNADGWVEAELTQLGSVDGEIGLFRADKFFNEGLELESEEKPKESVLRRSSAAVDMVSSPVRSNTILGTPSIRSESSSRNSQTALLQSFPTQVVPGRRSIGELVPRKKGFLSRICCGCSCVSKKSLNFDDHHFNYNYKAERRGSKLHMCRADELLQVSATPLGKPSMKDSKMSPYPSVKPSLLGKAISSPVWSKNPSPNLHNSVKNGSHDSLSIAMGNVRKSISLERKLNLLDWEYQIGLEDGNKATTISVEYYTDAESDASSDLFEIDSFTGQRKPSFSSQIPDSRTSGYTTPTTCYAPSEASIDWSVNTASAPDFSNMSDCEDFKPPNLVHITQRNRHAVTDTEILNRNNVDSSNSLPGCKNHKMGREFENMDLHKTRENVNYHRRMLRDQFEPFSGVQGQAGSHSSSVIMASFRQAT